MLGGGDTAICGLSLSSPYCYDSETGHHRICEDWQLAQTDELGEGELISKIAAMPEAGQLW